VGWDWSKVGELTDKCICYVCGFTDLDEPPYGLNGHTASFNMPMLWSRVWIRRFHT